MSIDLTFEEIRPYYDHEVNEVLKRLTSDASFIRILNYLYPEMDPETFNKKAGDIHTIHQFQKHFVYEAIRRVVGKTTNGLTSDGLENVDPEKNYIFISNHRDIILDSALLNFILFGKGFNTTEVAIGDNLLINPTVTDLVKLNKNFVVHRNVPSRQLFHYSNRLSAYIHHTLKEKKTSVWIAQKEGRTKNGIDKTQPGVLKMFGIASKDGFAETYKSLNIVPVSISYEYEPCDNLKAAELFLKASNIPYTKTKQDDRNSMVAGVMEPKGRVHFSIGKPIIDEIDGLVAIPNKNDQIKELALVIDKHIYKNYKLWPVNYIAFDLMNQSADFSSLYSPAEKENFELYIEERIKKVPGDAGQLKQLMLQIYGNPVKSFLSVQE